MPVVAIGAAAPAFAGSVGSTNATGGGAWLQYHANNLTSGGLCTTNSTIRYDILAYPGGGEPYATNDTSRQGYWVGTISSPPGSATVTGLTATFYAPTPGLTWTINAANSTTGWVVPAPGSETSSVVSGVTMYAYTFTLAGPVEVDRTLVSSTTYAPVSPIAETINLAASSNTVQYCNSDLYCIPDGDGGFSGGYPGSLLFDPGAIDGFDASWMNSGTGPMCLDIPVA